MRAILVGPPGVRDRLRWDLETRSIEVVGEFDTIVDARRAGLDADIVVSTPEPATRDSGLGIRDSGLGIRGSGFGIRDSGLVIRGKTAIATASSRKRSLIASSRSSSYSPRGCPTRALQIGWG